MGQDWEFFLDVIEVFGGFYICYIGFDMKRSGILTKYSLIGRNVVLSEAPDIPGFIQSMYLKYIICGGIFGLAGLASLLLDYRGMMTDTLFFVLTGILTADIILFAVLILRAQKRYLMP